jgi:hypothetical protein
VSDSVPPSALLEHSVQNASPKYPVSQNLSKVKIGSLKKQQIDIPNVYISQQQQ